MFTIELSPSAFAELREKMAQELGREPEPVYMGGEYRYVLDLTNIQVTSPLISCPDCSAKLQLMAPDKVAHLKHTT